MRERVHSSLLPSFAMRESHTTETERIHLRPFDETKTHPSSALRQFFFRMFAGVLSSPFLKHTESSWQNANVIGKYNLNVENRS